MDVGKSRNIDEIVFLGLRFANASPCDILELIKRWSASKSWTYVVTPNASHLVRIFEHLETICPLYDDASLILFDSRFVNYVSRAMGLKPPRVFAGSELTSDLFDNAIDATTRVCILGSSEFSVRQIQQRFRLGAIAHYIPPMGFINDPTEVEKAIRFVCDAKANYTFLAVGSPQQEIIAHRLSERDAQGVGLCVGAGIDFLVGERKRAPKIMRIFGLEWIFRFSCEPKRLFSRYFIESPRIFGILFEARFNRRSSRNFSKNLIPDGETGHMIGLQIDSSHVRRRATGIERITKEQFSAEALAPLSVNHQYAPDARLSVMAKQMIGLPLLSLRRRRDIFIFPGFPPSPYFGLIPKRCVLYVHDVFLVNRRENLNAAAKYYMAPCFRLALRRFKYFLTNSSDTASKLRPLCRRDAIIQCYRPTINNVFGLDVGDRIDRPHRPRKIVLVAIGTIEPRKNFSAAADISEELAVQLGTSVELHIIGRTGWGTDASDLATRPNVVLRGYLADTQAREVVAHADALICTSHEEGLGLPLLEVQYGGLPVIAPDDTVFREVLGDSGIFINPASPADAARRVKAAFAAPAWRSDFARLSQENLRRWNGLAEKDRNDVIAFLNEISLSLRGSPQ